MDTASDVMLMGLKCEYRENPIGIDVRQPRLSWVLQADRRGVAQTAYQVQVAGSEDDLVAGRLVWDSGRVASGQSIHVPYGGPALSSRQRCVWRVRAWDEQDRPTVWSDPAWWEIGLLEPADWEARWIEAELEDDTSVSQPAHMLRTTFHVEGDVASARMYVTCHGLFEAELNGDRVGDHVLSPGWTAYDHRLQYETHDVGQMLVQGENAIGVTLGDGWYRGRLGFRNQRNTYGDRLALLLQIEIAYEDGRMQRVVTGEGWKAATGPILASDIYDGETYDARLERPGWSAAGYDDSDWVGVRVVDHSKEILVAPAGPPVRRIEQVKPIEIIHTPADETVVDMGQNMVGWVRLVAQGEAGTQVVLRFAEVLDKEGNFYVENLRTAKQTDTYVLKGDGVETFEPHFTFHGFRYVAVEGYPGELTLDSLTGVVVHSDTRPIGAFECSNPLLNQLQHNIVWGQKGNFLDVPTDCPQRDERLGWTGDAQVFIRTACFNMDVAGFFTKWLRDLAADQAEDGSVPHVIPSRAAGGRGGSAAWGDAATICPWTIYLCYGDTRILQEQYDSMVAWVEYIRSCAGDSYLWNTGFHFGDWLSFQSPSPAGVSAITDTDLIATAFYAYSTSLVRRAAEVLGKQEDASRYAELEQKIKQAFCDEFVSPRGRVANNTQTAYALALMFDLLPEEQRPGAAQRLVQDIRRRGNHLSTGFVGTPYLCHVLSQFGHLDVAYDLLNQDTYPSWLYPVRQGATTIWERWDGIKPDGTFQDAGMNSFNHYAYGAIGEWMYRVVAGLDVDPQAPGYKHVLIQPRPGGGLMHARATLETLYGVAASGWQVDGDRVTVTAVVPANTTATVRLPEAADAEVTEGGSVLGAADGIVRVSADGDDLVVEVGSGSYMFAYDSHVLAQRTRVVLSIHTPLRRLLENEAARAVLQKHLPRLFESPMRDRAMDFSLRQIAGYASDMLSDEVLDQIDADLAEL